MTGNFLMGDTQDTCGDGMYPMVFVTEIEKDDLLRTKQDGVIIIDLDKKKFFNPNKNSWIDMKSFKKFKDQWR